MALTVVTDGVFAEEKRLMVCARELGLDVEVKTLSDCGWMNTSEFPADSMALIRIHGYFPSCHVSSVLEQKGVRVVNSAEQIELFGQKVKTDGWLLQNGLPAVPGGVAFSVEAARSIAEQLGYPIVMKPNIGGFGRLVQWIDSPRHLANVCEHLQMHASACHRTIYLQRAIHVERDLRVVLVGGSVVACVSRSVVQGEPNNLSRARTGVAYSLSSKEAEVIEALACLLPYGFFGVDLLVGSDGAVFVNEINAVCRFIETARISGADIARRVLTWGFARQPVGSG